MCLFGCDGLFGNLCDFCGSLLLLALVLAASDCSSLHLVNPGYTWLLLARCSWLLLAGFLKLLDATGCFLLLLATPGITSG